MNKYPICAQGLWYLMLLLHFINLTRTSDVALLELVFANANNNCYVSKNVSTKLAWCIIDVDLYTTSMHL